MSKFTNPLSSIKIASPCSADWNEMIGSERKRFCGDCKLNVYNLSGMSRREAENLLLDSEGRLCVRFYRRADGSILTKDCPVGWLAVKHRVSKTATAFASMVFAALSGIGLTNYFAKSNRQQTMGSISRIEFATTGEIAVEEINSNVDVREEPMPSMGAVDNVETSMSKQANIGRMTNAEAVRYQVTKKRRR